MPESRTVAISLVIPCYNRSHDLHRVLAAYEGQKGDEPFEIIAIDDGSQDETFALLSAYQPERFSLRAIRQESNQGPAAARNLGIDLASAPVILFAGDDILPDPYMVLSHIIQHRRFPNPETAILGRVQWPYDMPINTLMQHIDGIGAQQFSYYYFKDEQEYDFRHFYTANISIKRNFLKSIGKAFDTGFKYAAFEDVELSYRLAQRGLRIIYSFLILGYHYHYHTIWSFSTRQYHTGLMAYKLVQQHPNVAGLIMGRGWLLDWLGWSSGALLQPRVPLLTSELENACMHWLSAHEWEPHPLLDQAYLTVLRYYFKKGLIDGAIKNPKLAGRVNHVHAQQTLGKLARDLELSIAGSFPVQN
ncbi:MAG: glycosyltransferase family 2 protein [Chloroflexota bacterium]